MQHKSVFKALFTILATCALLMVGCLPIKPGAIKAKGRIYEQYTIGGNHSMYFFKLLAFKGNGLKVNMDATFTDKNKNEDSVTLNFSFYYPTIIKKLDSLTIGNGKTVAFTKEIQHIYTEKRKRSYVSRFTCKVKLMTFFTLYNDEKWQLNIFENGISHALAATKKTRKQSLKLKRNVIDIVMN